MLAWIDDVLEDEGLIGRGDKELLITADTPREVCDHVHRASRRQREVAGAA